MSQQGESSANFPPPAGSSLSGGTFIMANPDGHNPVFFLVCVATAAGFANWVSPHLIKASNDPALQHAYNPAYAGDVYRVDIAEDDSAYFAEAPSSAGGGGAAASSIDAQTYLQILNLGGGTGEGGRLFYPFPANQVFPESLPEGVVTLPTSFEENGSIALTVQSGLIVAMQKRFN